ncbi:hypothetical protein [Kordiimonas aestuarii]|uniref:hypothetical protein n=1 Tax=Kordiimonas aestuarii TaxID=1005925 RepID=UPI0021D05473|nr:hypothetical protein [Kordiimonas aestuarii]
MEIRSLVTPLLGFALLLSACADRQASPDVPEPELHFSITEGNIYNEFYRDGAVAAHTVLTSGAKPRLIVAYPAGNSGVSLWFEEAESIATWAKPTHMRPVTEARQTGTLYGVAMDLRVDAPSLALENVVLGNIRVIRTYLHEKTLDARLSVKPQRDGDAFVWSRARLDGVGGYKIALTPTGDTRVENETGSFRLVAGSSGQLTFHLTALTGDTPLTPLTRNRLLLPSAAQDELSRDILAFLSYEEKLLAGSWRFNTYFGRDTLLTTALLMPVLQDSAVDAAIGSVIDRLADTGGVAHEEDIGEFAVIRQLELGGLAEAKPVYDYAMVDEDYMLTPVLARYVSSKQNGPKNLATLLADKTATGETYGDVLMRNVGLVLASAKAFASTPVATNLISIEEGMRVGEWRDSQEGLGNGKYAYSVNAVLVPAALEAIAQLNEAGVLAPYAEVDAVTAAADYARVWADKAPELFDVNIMADQAKAEVSAYARAQGVPSEEAQAQLGADGVSFPALALDASGQPIPVVHSDPGFLLFFRDPSPELIESSLVDVFRPFPAGLMTPVGMVVANPAFASDELEAIFTKGHYHGPVVWPWQQAMMAAGLKRQLSRDDLPRATREKLAAYQDALWQVIDAGHNVKTAELWSWEYQDGAYLPAAYGQGAGHLTESNAAQLWSTVYLAVQKPEAGLAMK